MALSERDKEKIRIARELDVEAALNSTPGARDVVVGGYKDTGQWADAKETALAGLHRARLMQPRHFTAEERATSTKWLFEHGWRVRL